MQGSLKAKLMRTGSKCVGLPLTILLTKAFYLRCYWQELFYLSTSDRKWRGKEEVGKGTKERHITKYQNKKLKTVWPFWLEYTCLEYRLPRWHSGQECACGCRRPRFHPWVGKIPWRRNGNPLQPSRPGNMVGRGACGLQSLGSQKSWTGLSG